MFEILTFYIKLVVFSCFLNLGFSLKIARNTRLGERVCSLEDDMRMVKMKPKPMDLETAMQKFLLVKVNAARVSNFFIETRAASYSESLDKSRLSVFAYS